MIHKELTADFNGNLIALTGEMGHGKSTFVGAIQFCLTGEHPPWHRDDLVSWGAEEGSAKLFFTHEGLECSILRKLHTSEAVLKIGAETFSGARNVERTMTERLGIDKDILKQIGFVQQYEIQSILFDNPSQRERSFQKLLGIGDANKIWTDLGTIIQKNSKPENFDASIEYLKKVISTLEAELHTVDATLASAKSALDSLPSQDEMQQRVEQLAKVQSTINVLKTIRASLANLMKRSEDSLNKFTDLSNKRSQIANEAGKPLEELEKEVEELRTAHNMAYGELTNIQKLFNASTGTDKGSVCPLCGSVVNENQIKDHMGSELARLQEQEAQTKQLYTDAANFASRIKRELSSVDSALTIETTNMKVLSESIQAEQEREKHTLMSFAAFGVAPDQMDIPTLQASVEAELNAQRQITSEYSSLVSQVSTLQGEKNAKKKQCDQAAESLEAKIKEKSLSEPIQKKLDILTRVRSWFHSSNGPRTMSLSAIKEMTSYINEYLKAFHSEIEVTPDNQGLSFAYEYVDGRPVSDPPPSTSKLSGGQKIELALAFRLAIYRFFGQKMGIMVLDEPTAHLSPAGIEYFGELLQTVSQLAKNMNLQIIMPTHEKEIMPFMDSEIHFS